MYKALRKGKLLFKIPPAGTSQECSRCGHIHPENRRAQADFVCQRCGFISNADYNASLVIKKRGIRLLREGGVSAKDKKSIRFRKSSQIGQGLPESKRASVDCFTIGSWRGHVLTPFGDCPKALTPQ